MLTFVELIPMELETQSTFVEQGPTKPSAFAVLASMVVEF